MTPTRLLLGLSLLASPASAPDSARAQGLAVAPVSLSLAPDQRTATIGVSNRGTSPVVVQVRPFIWTERDNADELAPTEAVAVSPPFAEIAPNQTQTIRLVLRQMPGEREATYRLLIDEIPRAAPSGTIRVALRFSVPVFAAPAGPGAANLAANLDWTVGIGPSGATLTARNQGMLHARILSADLAVDGGAVLPIRTLGSPYILPGAQRQWPIADAGRLRGARTARLRAQSDAGSLDAIVPITRNP